MNDLLKQRLDGIAVPFFIKGLAADEAASVGRRLRDAGTVTGDPQADALRRGEARSAVGPPLVGWPCDQDAPVGGSAIRKRTPYEEPKWIMYFANLRFLLNSAIRRIMQIRNTSSLRKGRMSLAEARYFFTICVRRPENRLVSGACAEAIGTALSRCESDGDWKLMASTVMPDHLHVLATLSGRLSVGQVIGKFKVLTKPALALADIRWQENFHEHRLRPGDVPGNYARYIFLNPYREKLISRCEDWPFWSKAGDVDFDFVHQLDAGGRPPEEWLTEDVESLGVSLDAIGEM